MTFNFGFATDDAFYLAADRRRVHEQPVPKVEDTKTKLHEVNRWTYLTGSGFLYFVDDVVAPQALNVFGADKQDTAQLEVELPRLSKQLAAIHTEVARQAGVPNPQDLYSKFSLAGVDAGAQPFSCEWNSQQGFVGLAIGRRHCFFLPRADSTENDALRQMISKLQSEALQGTKLKRLAREARSIMNWVAARDEAVSGVGDIVLISTKGARRRAF